MENFFIKKFKIYCFLLKNHNRLKINIKNRNKIFSADYQYVNAKTLPLCIPGPLFCSPCGELLREED